MSMSAYHPFRAAIRCALAASCRVVAGAVLALTAARSFAQPLVWDPDFAPEIVHRAARSVDVFLTAAVDGTFFVTGDATHLAGQRVPGIVRLGADGAPDAGFAFGGETLGRGDVVAPLADGRFLVVHRADPPDGADVPVIRRYLATGALDLTFPELPLAAGFVAGALRQADGSILIHGTFGSIGGVAREGLARFDNAGTFDAAYAPTLLGPNTRVLGIAAAPAGKVIVLAEQGWASDRLLVRLEADGRRDAGFNPPGSLVFPPRFFVQRDGRVIFCGSQPMRLGADGVVDAAFDPLPPNGEWMMSYSLENGVGLKNGELLLQVIAFGDWSITRSLVRCTAEGVLLGPWPGSGELVGLTPEGQVVTRIAGQLEPMDGFGSSVAFLRRAPEFYVYPQSGAGSVSLQPDLGFPGAASLVQVDDAGSVWVAGEFSWIDGAVRPGLGKLRADGTLDPTFSPPEDLGRLWLGVREPDGHAWVYAREASDAWWRRLRRLNPDGSLSATGTTGSDLGNSRARILGLDREGRILAGVVEPADTMTLRLARFDAASGARLATLPAVFTGDFGLNQLHEPALLTDLRVLADGSLVFAGTFHQVDGQPGLRLCRLRADGSVDTDYQARVAVHGVFLVKALLHDGSALVALYGSHGIPDRFIRLLPDGNADTSFAFEHTGALPSAMTELRDGTLVALESPLKRWRTDGSRIATTNAAEGLSVRGVAQEADADWVVACEFGVLRLAALTTPGIVIPPVARSVASGERVEFSVEVGDTGAATFQWQRDGVDIAGATRSTLVITAASAAEAGVYRVIIRVGAATYVSDGVTLTVRPSTAHLVNFSARSRVPMDGPPQIAGFVVAGDAPRRVLLRAIGLEVPSSLRYRTRLMDPALALFAGEACLASDARSARAPAMLELAERVGAFEPKPWEVIPGIFINYDSALAWDLGAGSYTLQTSSPTNAAGISLAEFYDAGEGAPLGFVRNLSLRGRTAAGEDTLIGGFIVRGEGGLRLLVRVVGAELTNFGVGRVLEDPRLRLYRDSAPIASNDSWDDRSAEELAGLVATSRSVGAFALMPGSQSAASVVEVLPGSYTVHAESVQGLEGEVLLELYVVDDE